MGILGVGQAVSVSQMLLRTVGGAVSGNEQPEESAAAPVEDELLLSDAAQAAQDDLASAGLGRPLNPLELPLGDKAAGRVTVDDLREAYLERRDALAGRIADAFDEAGIDTSEPVRLTVGFDGRVTVAGDHPQRAEIEQIFRETPGLRDQFVQTAALGDFVRSADEAIAFQAAYAKDPYAAVAQYSHLFSGQPQPSFSLLVRDGTATVEFV